MALPGDLDLREIVGTYVDYSGTPISGQIEFTSNVRLISDGSDTAVIPSVIIGTLDASGQLKAADGIAALMLPATTDTDIYPEGWTYSVVEKFDAPYDSASIEYNLIVPIDALNPLDLPSVSPSTPPSEPGVQPVTSINGKNPDGLGQVTLTATDVGAAATTHTHASTDVTGLATVATSGSYNDLTDLPGPASVDWSSILNKPATFTPSSHTHVAGEVSGLATVATTGAYNDLSGTPDIDAAIQSALSDTPLVVKWSGSAWPARSATTRPVVFIGGSAATDEPTDIDLASGDRWYPETA